MLLLYGTLDKEESVIFLTTLKKKLMRGNDMQNSKEQIHYFKEYKIQNRLKFDTLCYACEF